ncbi:IS66 family insertion sequence element accessory protein TnpB [Desulfosediminicola sp.]|uniref:IS66 family insertion sequence element accessory protein TnpB n=1 Tax=Desulfosediminicola sp. TaxID=2886825 RepID=UPI003AF2E451
MTPTPENVRVYFALGATDMRKSINGLSLLVGDQFDLDLFSGNLFTFCNRRRDIVKILYWYQNGFCIWQKRLEADIFCWPESEDEVIEIHETALRWLLHGLDLQQAHTQPSYNSVA